jgi:hypothetical protein
MFVREEVQLPVGFDIARGRLARLISTGSLVAAAHDTYGAAINGKLRIGPLGSAPVLSRLVEVNFRDLVIHDDTALLTLRWKAVGPGGALFPVLDADITLSRTAADSAQLRLDGVYRPPLGAAGAGLDRAILNRVATATIRRFIGRVADEMTQLGAAVEPVAGPADAGITPWWTAPETPY